MGNLEEILPNIVQKALLEEDKITSHLATTLIRRVYLYQNNEKLKTVVTSALDTEVKKLIEAGMITEIDYMESDENGI